MFWAISETVGNPALIPSQNLFNHFLMKLKSETQIKIFKIMLPNKIQSKNILF